MSDFDIEKNVPLPKHDVFRKRKYPFIEMEVGESFFVKGPKSKVALNGMKSIARYYRDKFNLCFTVKQVEGGIRCWRCIK